jgi:G3E family GTPase
VSSSHAHDHDHEHDHAHRHAPADAFVLDAPGPVSAEAVKRFFEAAPEGLWRAKGFLQIDGAPSLVQFAMGELEITGAGPRDKDYLVLIGHGLDYEALVADFAARMRESEAA